MKTTPNYKLKQLESTDKFDTDVLGYNAERIDGLLKEISGLDLQEITAEEVEALFE